MSDKPEQNAGPDHAADFDQVDFEPTAEQKKENRLANLLANVQMGWKISVMREQPTWCRGHLETFEVYDPSETLDIDYLIRTWGGQRLHLKVHDSRGQWIGGGSVSLFSYPPKVQGVELKQSEVFGHSPAQQSLPVVPIQQNPMPGASQQIDISKLFTLLQAGKKNELDLALKILERTANNPQSPQQTTQPAGSMFEQMSTMMQMFSQMREFLGDMSGGSGSQQNNGDDLTPVIGDVVKGLFQNMQGGPVPPAKPALVPPKSTVEAPQVPPLPEADHSVPGLRPVEGIGAGNLQIIANHLSSLSSQDAVDVVLESLGNMPENKRSEVMQLFMGEMVGDSGVDGLLNQDDTYSQDEEDTEIPPADHNSQNTGG